VLLAREPADALESELVGVVAEEITVDEETTAAEDDDAAAGAAEA
jgi:hypothetical protein